MVNSSYPDGGSEIKETRPARGKAPEWNQTIEFDVTDRPVRKKYKFLFSFFILIIYFKKNKGEIKQLLYYLLVKNIMIKQKQNLGKKTIERNDNSDVVHFTRSTSLSIMCL